MGTRSLTFVYNEDNKKIINLYRQLDGYPSCHGLKLAKFLDGLTLVDGLSSNQTERVANGMECLAAQLVACFKTRPGNFYLEAVNLKHCGQEYEYHVYKNKVIIKAGFDGYRMKPRFTGDWNQFKIYCEK